MPCFFNNDISFNVAENGFQIETLRLFGEKLLHLEFKTAYGKKEILCGAQQEIQNFVMLAVNQGEPQRFEVFASYSLDQSGDIEVNLRHGDGISEKWNISVADKKFIASGEKTLCGTLILSEAESI